ncbi:MAG: hypothetical protein RL318_2106 [Fibrobacterota bacterium]|jgi:hypothetical protein
MNMYAHPSAVPNSTGGVSHDHLHFGLVADYRRELILSYCLESASEASIEVLRPDGKRVASFGGSARARNLTLPVRLAQGAYLVLVQGGASRFVAPLAVAA